jgi:hypothetical protein
MLARLNINYSETMRKGDVFLIIELKHRRVTLFDVTANKNVDFGISEISLITTIGFN